MPTYTPKKQDVSRKWHRIDGDGAVLGRLAVEIAGLLRGKHKPQYSPHVDCGDYVVVVNADKLAVSGQKAQQVMHYTHSGYPGGLKAKLLADELDGRPERVLRRAVRGMMPRNRLSRQSLKKLKIYSGPDHPHEAQFRGTPGEPNQGKRRKTKGEKLEGVESPKADVVEPPGSEPEVVAESALSDEEIKEVAVPEAAESSGVPLVAAMEATEATEVAEAGETETEEE